jgi:NDP-sugar pyrophosphorylase family protein
MSFFPFERLVPTSKRSLKKSEIEILINHHNSAESWDTVFVSEFFNVSGITNCSFSGTVYIGKIDEKSANFNGFYIQSGLKNSSFHNCVISDGCTIKNCGQITNYVIENDVIISNVSEISSNNGASFGHAFNQTKSEKIHSIALINENGGRKIVPFTEINCTDAWFMVKNGHNDLFGCKIKNIVTNSISKSNSIATIGKYSRILNTTCIRNCLIHPYALVDGARHLENSTILSDQNESTSIKSGVEINNSIIGYGNDLQSSCLLKSCITGTAVSISQSARISESFIGDNSAISCCEIAHSFVYPFHNQHHNNSFLIASCIGGQSNLAAGATVGSNHNSRVNDGELWAGRGFWPGLCTSFKHNSRFASYTTAAKADYQSEIDLPYPFSLISNDLSSNSLIVYPAWAISSNLYSLIRSSQKFQKRDKRIHKNQIIELSPFAPDTIEECFNALNLIELYALCQQEIINPGAFQSYYQSNGQMRTFIESGNHDQPIDLKPYTVEKSNRKVTLLKPGPAWNMYRLLIEWFSVSTIAEYDNSSIFNALSIPFKTEDTQWVNAGGQIMRKCDVQKIVSTITDDDSITYWNQIHEMYNNVQHEYSQNILKYAINSLYRLQDTPVEKNVASLSQLIEKSMSSIDVICELTIKSRQKDFTDPFRTMVYDSSGEAMAVLGTIDDDPVIKNLDAESTELKNRILKILGQL